MKKIISVFLSASLLMGLGTSVYANESTQSTQEVFIGQGEVIYKVYGYKEASTSSTRLGVLYRGASVDIISIESDWAKVNYKGIVGYLKKDSLDYTLYQPKIDASKVDLIIQAGERYLGTPYEYGSSRNDTRTFDCSDFVRQTFLDALELDISKGGSSYQFNLLKERGYQVITDPSQLKKGDIVFMGPYRGYRDYNYSGSPSRISHNAIYAGDGQLLHTYSKESGGVRYTDFYNTHWEWRFYAGVRIIQ